MAVWDLARGHGRGLKVRESFSLLDPSSLSEAFSVLFACAVARRQTCKLVGVFFCDYQAAVLVSPEPGHALRRPTRAPQKLDPCAFRARLSGLQETLARHPFALLAKRDRARESLR